MASTDSKVLNGEGLVELVKKIKGVDKAIGARIDTLAEDSHTHGNKDILDTYDQTNDDITDAVGKRHAHANGTTLDGITSAKVTSWDNAAKASHAHSNLNLLETYTQTEANLADAVAKKHSHTTAQNNAMDSGITQAKVSGYDTHLADTEVHVTTAERTKWDGKQDKLTNTDAQIQAAVTKAHTHSNGTVLDGITSTKVTNWDNAAKASHSHKNQTELDKIATGDKAKWDAKQDALSDTQMNAVNSGITETKVTGYDSHLSDTTVHITAAERTKWNGKQDKLTNTDTEIQNAVSKAHSHTPAQTNAMDSGITSTKVSGYDSHISNSDIHVTADDKATWSGKQDKLTNTDTEIQDAVTKAHSHSNNTVLDGISSTKVTNWDNAAKASHSHTNKDLLDTYTQTEANLADAVAKKHSHSAAQTNAMNSGITSAKVTGYDAALAYIPAEASATNKLADKAYVDAIGERLESRYLAASAQGEPFATHAALTTATKYYYNGTEVTPDTNDVTVVIADEDHTGVTGEPSTTRYRWVGGTDDGSWAFEYVINNSALSQAQLLAVNSGITSTKVGNYDSHVADTTVHITSAERTKWNGKQDALAFDGTYNKSTNKVATVSTVTTAIGKLDGSVTGTPGAGKTLTAFSETDGVVTATFGNIAITKSQVTDFPESLPPTEHTHGFLNNIGVLTNSSTTLQSNYVIAIAQGDGMLMKSGIAFDTLTTTTALTPKGTWEEFAKPDDVSSAIEGLDGVITGTPGAGKTLTAFSETDGVVTATFGNISITKSQVSDFPTSMTPTSHAHGNITNGGTITADTTLEKDDQLVITDANGSGKVARSPIKFDATTTTKALTPKGTWESFAKAGDITTAIQGLDGSITGTPGAGQTLTAFSETDGVVTATFGDISITKSQVSDFPTSMTPTSHAHGSITNSGTITADTALGKDDQLVIADASASGKVVRSPIKFDGSTTTTALTPKGTWESFAKAGDITTAIQALDGSITGTPGPGKTLTAFNETDGVVTATFDTISITKSQVSDFPSTMTPSAHTHGNITNDGKLQTDDVAIASGDKLVVTDASNSSKVARTSISFDGSTTTKALTQKGTWESFAKAGDITTAIQALDGSITGTPGAGKTLTAFSETDGKVTATFGTISITKSQVSDFPSTMTPSAHTHGFLDNSGVLTNSTTALQSNYVIAIAQGDGTLMKSGIAFDAATKTKALTPNGTWETFLQSGDIDGKADKVSGATAGDIATLDANGNLVDSGKKPGDYVPVASINLEGKTTTMLAQVQALQTAGTDYARFRTNTDGGAAGVSDRPPASSVTGFACEALRVRNNGATDWLYQLICWQKRDNNPYVAWVNQSTTAISWSRLNTNTDTKVTETLVSDNAEYPLLLTPKAQTATTTTTATFDSGVTLNPSTNTITASITGVADRTKQHAYGLTADEAFVICTGSVYNGHHNGVAFSMQSTDTTNGNKGLQHDYAIHPYMSGSATQKVIILGDVSTVQGTNTAKVKFGVLGGKPVVYVAGPARGYVTNLQTNGDASWSHTYTKVALSDITDLEEKVTRLNYLTSGDVKSTYTATDENPINGKALNAALGSYLPLAGGAMTGNISYKGTASTNEMIRFRNSTDGYGNGISIGGGGNTIIGSGEAATAAEGSYSSNVETLVLASDNGLDIRTNVQNGIASSKLSSFNTDGTLTLAASGSVASGDTSAVTGGTVYSAITGLDAAVTSTDGKNVQVKVTETDGKVSAVNITTDNTANKDHEHPRLVAEKIDSKTDLNTLTPDAEGKIKTYYWAASAGPANLPTACASKGGMLTMYQTSGTTYGVQEVRVGSQNYGYFVRHLVNGTWDDWKVVYYEATSEYSATGKQQVNGTAVAAAIGALDVTAKTGTTTQTITSISETDGKISVTYSDIATMGAATASAAGTKGLVPAPGSGKQNSFLRGDGTWVVPTNTDTKQNVVLATTTKAYITGVNASTAPTATATGRADGIADTGVYMTTTAGQINATSYKIYEKATFQYNSADNAIDLVW